MAHPPLAWIRRLDPELKELDQIPLFGNAPPFDVDKYAALIATRFGIQDFGLKTAHHEWREREELKKGLGPNLLTIPITASPLNGEVFWMMSHEDISRLSSWIISGKHRARALLSESLEEGFYRYLLLEALDTIQGMEPMSAFSFHLNEEASLPEERSYCIDFEISMGERSVWGRLAIPSEFKRSWVQNFSQLPSEYYSTEISRVAPLVLGVKTGALTLRRDEWDEVKKGDFLVLDSESYDARRGIGVATLMLGQTPLFNIKIKQNKIEILDYAFYHEETMQDNIPAEPAETEAAAIKDLPIHMTVELARLKITLDQLMHLNPGNMLELPVHPEQGVSLTVNGQKVGKAELVYLGETLGIRILEIG